MKKGLFLFVLIFSTFRSYSQDTIQSENKPIDIGIALGVSASTNGLGATIVTGINKNFAIRLSYERFDNNNIQIFYPINNPINVTKAGQEFSVKPAIKIGGISGIIDYYIARLLYLSVGGVYNNFDLTANMNLDKITINKVTLENQGGLSLSILPEHKLSPYIGIGFGRNISDNKRFIMNFELGAYHMGSYVLTMNGTGLLEGNNTESLKTLNEELKKISWSGIYPVLKLGVSYKIWKN